MPWALSNTLIFVFNSEEISNVYTPKATGATTEFKKIYKVLSAKSLGLKIQ